MEGNINLLTNFDASNFSNSMAKITDSAANAAKEISALRGILDGCLKRANEAWIKSMQLPRKKKKHVRKYIKAWASLFITMRP